MAQKCFVTTSVPAKPPKSGKFETMRAAPDVGYYSTSATRIYDTYDSTGFGPYTQIDPENTFWKDKDDVNPGPMNRCAVWGNGNPKRIGISVCVTTPADKAYYFGFGADNSGTLTIDGDTVLRNIDFVYWGIYKYNFTKGKHLVEFSVINYNDVAALGFELYNNTAAEIAGAYGYSSLNLLYSTHQEIGALAQDGEPDSTYTCPIGTIIDYCNSFTPVCTTFVPISLTVNNPAPACKTASVDITAPAITAGSPSALTYTYWKDSTATLPLENPKKVTQSGVYYILGSFNECRLIKPVTVVINAVSTNISKNICPGESFMGHTKAGSYTDTLTTAGGCDSLVTLNLTVSQKVNLGPDRSLCAGDSVLLSPGTFNQYLWQDNSTKPDYVVRSPGTYWVTVTNENGCSSSDTVVVKYDDCLTLKIPNTFTPNADGINDTWDIGRLVDFPQCTVFIYNRWGMPVFKSIGYPKPWDGTYNGKKLPTGTYYYVIDLKNNAPPRAGFLTIIR